MTRVSERIDMQDGFVFRGGVLALELVNTEIMVRGKPQDLLVTPQDLERWWAVTLERYPEVGGERGWELVTPELLAAVKHVRSALRRVCGDITRAEPSDEADRATINQALRMAHVALTGAPGARLRQSYVLVPGGSDLLFQVALSIMRLLTEGDMNRLHKCRNERCVLYFYDSTKSGTRQWCSLDCLNRVRSSENYRRRKAATHAEGS